MTFGLPNCLPSRFALRSPATTRLLREIAARPTGRTISELSPNPRSRERRFLVWCSGFHSASVSNHNCVGCLEDLNKPCIVAEVDGGSHLSGITTRPLTPKDDTCGACFCFYPRLFWSVLWP